MKSKILKCPSFRLPLNLISHLHKFSSKTFENMGKNVAIP